MTGHPFGLALPFFIDWLDSPHPAIDAPGGCLLNSFEVTCKQAADYQQFCDAIHLEVTVHEGEMSLQAVVDSLNGKVVL